MSKSVKSLIKAIKKEYPMLTVEEYCNCIRISGELDSWDEIVKVGKMAVTDHSLGVLNDVKLKGFEEKLHTPRLRDFHLDGNHYDVMIIGAGAFGCSVARELSRYDISVLMVDKENDVGMGQSSRNDGDIRVNLYLDPKQLKYKYSVKGRDMFDRIAEELSIDYKHTNRLVLFENNKQRASLFKLKQHAKKSNNEIEYLPRNRVLREYPFAPKWNKGAFLLKSGGEICPYQYVIALAENAVENGVELSLNTIVEGMYIKDGYIDSVQTNRGKVYPKIVINAAGVFSDKVAEMAGDRTFTIHPKKGTLAVFDRKKDKPVTTSMNRASFLERRDEHATHSKGSGIFHTIYGNTLIGQSVEETPYREDYTTDQRTVDELLSTKKQLVNTLNSEDVITYFSGIRASNYEEDFVVRRGIFTKNIIEIGATQAPGLTASPAIAEDVCEWTIEMLDGAKENFSFHPYRKGVTKIKQMEEDERNKFIRNNPDYGVIVCGCEEISKGEIVEAVNGTIPALTVDAVKRRVRAGAGRCQGGSCSPKVAEIISKTAGIPLEHVNKSEENSPILLGNTRGNR